MHASSHHQSFFQKTKPSYSHAFKPVIGDNYSQLRYFSEQVDLRANILISSNNSQLRITVLFLALQLIALALWQ